MYHLSGSSDGDDSFDGENNDADNDAPAHLQLELRWLRPRQLLERPSVLDATASLVASLGGDGTKANSTQVSGELDIVASRRAFSPVRKPNEALV